MQRRVTKLAFGLVLTVVTVVLPTRAGTLQGTVRDAVTNTVLSGIWVNVLQGPDPGYAGDDAWDWVNGAHTDANGHFSFAGLAARHYRVRADSGTAGTGGRYLENQHLDITVDAVGTATVPDLLLRQAGYLYGYVRDAGSTQPVPGAEVLVQMSFTEDGNNWHTAFTDGTGRYELFVAPSATAVYPVQIVRAAGPGPDQWYAVQIAPALYPASVAGTPGPDFNLSLGGVIRGRVTTPDGTPVPFYYAVRPFAHIAGGTFQEPGGETDADGVFQIVGVPPGVDVWLMTSSWNPGQVAGTTYGWGERFVGPYRVTAGGTLDVPSLYMAEVGSVLVTTRDAGNSPLPDVYVEMTGYDQFGGVVWFDDDDTMTDAQGHFLFADVPPGRYVIKATKEGYAVGVSAELAVTADSQPQPVVVLTAAGGPCTISGSITNFAEVAPQNQGGAVLPFVLMDDYGNYDLPGEIGVFSYPVGTTWSDEQLPWVERQISGGGDIADGYVDYLQAGGSTAGTYTVEAVTSGSLALCVYNDRATGISGGWATLLSDPVVCATTAGQDLAGVGISVPIGTGKVEGTVSFPAGYTPDLAESTHQIHLRLQGSTAPLGRAVGQAGPSLQYALVDLPAGTYELYAVARGMQTYTSAFFALAAGQTVTRDITFTAAAANQPPVIDNPATDQVKPEAWEGEAFRHDVEAHDPDTFNSLRYSWWGRADGSPWTQVFERPGDPLARPVRGSTIPFGLVVHPATSLANVESKVIVEDNFGVQSERVFRALTLRDVNRAPVQAGQSVTLSGGANHNDPVVCALNMAATDPDAEDTISYTYTWQRTGATVTRTTTALTDTLPIGNLAKGQTWTCAVTARDQMGLAWATPVVSTNSVTIGNLPPTVVNGNWSVESGAILSVGVPGVLTGSSDPDGDGRTAVPVNPPSVPEATAHGTLLSLGGSGAFSYRSAPGYSGPDTFTFRASDGTGLSNVGLVTITVTAPADATPPSVTELVPAAAAVDVPTNAALRVVFDEPVVRGTGHITIHAVTRAVVEAIPVDDARVAVVGDTVTINPAALLAGGTDHYVLVDAGAFLDAVGNPFGGIADPGTWSFTTAVWVDTDGDGLDDNWETVNLGDLRYGADSDPDGDGLTNATEFAAASDPAGYTLHLAKGWNVVSVARPPVSRKIEDVFGETVCGGGWVWNTALGRFAMTDVVDPLLGVWVFAPAAVAVQVEVPLD